MKAYTVNSPRVVHVTSVWGIALDSRLSLWRRLLRRFRPPYQPLKPNG